MGQTLTHGIYLPDEGERNCYSGLAGNWQILDSSVGTIAEHTSALAGKAPLVHTHTVSDITDFPAYGNAAGTICEGNDSRLSDARTPVAHTHGKADITDLFNSANTWGAWQTIERTNVEPLLRLRRTDLKIGEAASNQNIGTLAFAGSDDLNFGLIGSRDFSGGDTQLILLARQKYDANNDRSTNGTQKETRVEIGINTPSNKYFRPNSNGDVNLGTSTNQWNNLYAKKVNTQSVNGTNPGALSLPSGAAENINTDNWNFSWNVNYVTAPFDGYISIACFGSVLQINNETKAYAMTFAPGADGYICGLLPVSSGDSIKVLITRTQTSIYEGYKFIKASGNVS